jgi:hypothetical protein
MTIWYIYIFENGKRLARSNACLKFATAQTRGAVARKADPREGPISTTIMGGRVFEFLVK